MTHPEVSLFEDIGYEPTATTLASLAYPLNRFQIVSESIFRNFGLPKKATKPESSEIASQFPAKALCCFRFYINRIQTISTPFQASLGFPSENLWSLAGLNR